MVDGNPELSPVNVHQPSAVFDRTSPGCRRSASLPVSSAWRVAWWYWRGADRSGTAPRLTRRRQGGRLHGRLGSLARLGPETVRRRAPGPPATRTSTDPPPRYPAGAERPRRPAAGQGARSDGPLPQELFARHRAVRVAFGRVRRDRHARRGPTRRCTARLNAPSRFAAWAGPIRWTGYQYWLKVLVS